MGLWNRLTAHQDRKHPFRLTRFDVPQTREGLEHVARVRREEIDGFVDGLFGSAEVMDLPERAHRALNVLSEIRAMLEGVRRLAADTSKPAREADLAGTLRNVRELTRIAEQEIHAAVLSCTRARRSMLEDADRKAYSALIFPGHPLPTSHILNRIERTALHGAGN